MCSYRNCAPQTELDSTSGVIQGGTHANAIPVVEKMPEHLETVFSLLSV